jgi:acyl-CoA thioester hydrolase
MTSKRFVHPIVVAPEDIDDLGHVNNVVYVKWVQEVAAAHWQSVASAQLIQKYSWVVLRHEIDYRNPAFTGDVVSGETWVGEHNGARFERYVKLSLEADKKVLAEAKTIWCMLDAQTLRPQRIPVEVLELL